MPRKPAPATALGLLITLFAMGCSSDKPQSYELPEQATWQPGPLDRYLGISNFLVDEDEEASRERNRQRETLISQCMAERGFEYIPWVNNTIFKSDLLGPFPGTIEFAEDYGYGIVEYPHNYREDATGPDPNEEYVLSMDQVERDAYYEAHMGPPIPDEVLQAWTDGEIDYPQRSWEELGCTGWADHEMEGGGEGPTSYREDPAFDDLRIALDALDEEILADPEHVKLDQEWASCMADEGHLDLKSPRETEDELQMEWYGHNNYEGPEPADLKAAERDYNKAMKELQKREKELAVADFHCQEQLDYASKAREIDLAHQERFVEEHKAELDRMALIHGND